MALDNVRFYEYGEWRPITIEEADKLYDDSVSVDSHTFMCYAGADETTLYALFRALSSC